MSISPSTVQNMIAGSRLSNESPPFEVFLDNWARHISHEQWRLRKLIEMSVTIHRRCRGLTISDQYGNWGTRSATDGRWIDYNRDEAGDVHPINIVQDTLRTQTNACLQSESDTEVSSANQSAKYKQIAARWQRIADYFERVTWPESKRQYIFDAAQKTGNVLTYTYLEKDTEQEVADIKDSKGALAVYHCETCNKSGLEQTEMPESGEQVPDDKGMPQDAPKSHRAVKGMHPCPNCQAPAPALFTPMAGLALGKNSIPTFKIKNKIIPFYNFTIDTYGSRIEGIQGAKWLQVQDLRDRMELETKYPHQNFGGAEQWSYATRCDYALATADWSYLNWWRPSQNQVWDFDRYEVREIYLHEDVYSNYKAPEDYEFVNGQGERTFSIKRGQWLRDVWGNSIGRNVEGFKFVWNDQRTLDIVSPKDEEINFRECFSDVRWSAESGSYLSSPYYSIVDIQDQITLLNTMNVNIVARNAVNPVFFNSRVFEQADFSKEYIGTKNEAIIDENTDLQKQVISLPIPTPSPYLSQHLNFLFEVKDGVVGVTKAMRGESQSGQPYAAQRQQLEQSMGGLTSVLKSFAQCKNIVFTQQASLAKRTWTLEQFQKIGSLWGEIWTEQDIAEMCEADFEEDLVVSYRTGSEMPQSLLAKEMKFMAGLQSLLPMLQAFPQLVGVDKLTEIMQHIGETMGVDFQITDLETNEMIAQKRAIVLAELCKQYDGITSEQVDQMKNTIATRLPVPPEQMQASIQLAQSQPNNPQAIQQAQAMTQGQPVTRLDLITEQIFHESGIKFSQYEDLQSQQAFFVNVLRQEFGKEKENYILEEILNVLLGMIQKVMQSLQDQELQSNPEYKMKQQELQQQQQSDAADKNLQQQKISTEQAKIAVDAQHRDADRQHEQYSQQADIIQGLVHKALDQEHEDSNTPNSMDKMTESINLKDLPPKQAAQLARRGGLDASTSDFEAKAKADNAAKVSAAKTKPKTK